MAQPEFDWSQAESLLGDDPTNVDEDMSAIVVELIDASNTRFAELKKLNPQTQVKEVSSLAHQLRGSLLNFGFTATGVVLQKIESGGFPVAEYLGLVDKAQEIFVESKKMLADRYKTLPI